MTSATTRERPAEAVGGVLHTVVFQPSGARGQVRAGETLRSAAGRVGVEIESLCAESATCGKCRVLIEHGRRGKVISSPAHASRPSRSEIAWITRRERTLRRMGLDPDRLRLSCQARVEGDMIVFVPETSRGNRQLVRKAATDRAIEIRPAIRRYHLELARPTLDESLADVERLGTALVSAMDRIRPRADGSRRSVDDLEFDLPVLRAVGSALRGGDWKVSVTVRQDREVIDVQPGHSEDAYGAAVDIGSTSLAVYVCDLFSGDIVASESMMNPQTAVGDDIVSRMMFEAENEDGLKVLRDLVVGGVNQILERALSSAGLNPADLVDLVVVGNTTMHHLFVGISTENLGVVPFVPAVHHGLDIKARDLGLTANHGASVHLPPITTSFIGADTIAVLLAEELSSQDDQVLVVDIGTNAELVLGNRDGLLATSTPTGPALEGAHIEYGMRAAVGAVERIEIDGETLEPRYRVIGSDAWHPGPGDAAPVKGICGSAIIDGVAEMFRVGIVNGRGHFDKALASDRIREGDLGWEYVVAWDSETSIGRGIPITQQDVRQVQLAKAALYTAAKTLLRHAGADSPAKIILAGAFGSYVDPEKALLIGMIPDCPVHEVVAVGNAAGDGARIALLNREKRAEAAEIASSIRTIQLPIDPEFQKEYINATAFPHETDRFPSIEHLIR